MTFVIGRRSDGADERPTARLGRYSARDGSPGAPLALDVDRPHAVLVVGKRGYGKSHTVGVLAEALARTDGIAPVVVDPMGEFRTLAAEASGEETEPVPAVVESSPTVPPGALDPKSWCSLLALSPESGAGGLVWRAAAASSSLAEMREYVRASDARASAIRAARNHLDLASSWDVFGPDGLSAASLAGPEATVLDVSGLDPAPMNAVLRAVAEALYRARLSGWVEQLPWLLVDEAHTFFDGVAASSLETVLTRGRAPGVSVVLATQRPSAVPDVAVSQSDVLVAHRLTSVPDLDALSQTRSSYMQSTIVERMPTEPGDVLVLDDATETVHTARVRRRDTPHGGGSPRASETDGVR